jgi:GT2 family glycosyltransferase
MQKHDGTISFSTVVVDNDRAESARPVVMNAAQGVAREAVYCVEPAANIAMVRNRAALASHGDFIAFIDDDELPDDDWLQQLVTTCRKYDADGVLGPVLPRFVESPPAWLARSGIFDRPRHPTGHVLAGNETRSGNALLRRALFDDAENRFDPAYAGSHEDRDFFMRMMAKGYRFVWCDEAVVHETEPAERMRRRYSLRRALRRGNVAYSLVPSRARAVCRSVVAAVAYTAALPLLQCAGHHLFMRYLVKLCDHSGLLLAAVGCRLDARPSREGAR